MRCKLNIHKISITILLLLSSQVPLAVSQNFERDLEKLKRAASADEYSSRGMAALDEGDYEQAISYCTKAIELKPSDPAVYYYRGRAYEGNELYDKAISDYTKAIELDPNLAPLYDNRAGSYYYKGQYQQAIADYSKTIELDPKYASAYNNRGHSYEKLELYDKAIADFTKGIEFDPKFVKAYINRGVVYREKGQYDQAISDFSEALRINPANGIAQKNREEVLKLKADSGNKTIGQSKSEGTTGQNAGKTWDEIISESAQGTKSNKSSGEQSKSGQAKGGDVWDQLINEAAQGTKSDKRSSEQSKSEEPKSGDEDFWCDTLLKTRVDEANLPKGYSHPQISSLDMTADEVASGMLCKISVALQGPDAFNAIRFRFYRDFAAAERGLKSLAKMVPGITVVNDKLFYGEDIPCMAYTTGNQPVTFVTCANVDASYSLVISGVSSQPKKGNSVISDTIVKAGRLFNAGKKHWGSIMFNNIEQIGKDVFGPDEKK